MTRLFMSIVFVVVASAIITGVNGVQQCYVCVPTADYDGDVTKMFPREELPLCGTTLVAKVCPPASRGCLTEINGPQVIRTCAPLAMNDCKTANLVEYCYCTGNLCNSGAVEVHKQPPDDDEDLAEGSGMGATVMPQTPKSTSTTTTTSSNSVKTANSATTHSITRTLSITYVLFVLLLLMWH